MADQDYSNMSRADLLREVEMMRKALRATQDSINAGSGSDYTQRALKDTAQRQTAFLPRHTPQHFYIDPSKGIAYGSPGVSSPKPQGVRAGNAIGQEMSERMISDMGRAMAEGHIDLADPKFAGRNATQNLKVWEAFQKAQQQQALQDTPQELLEDVDFKDLVELFGKAFGPGEDMQNLGQGLWQAGKQSVMSPGGPGGMLKSLIDLLKQEKRREAHFPERYKQRNYDVTLPDESGFQWPNLSQEP